MGFIRALMGLLLGWLLIGVVRMITAASRQAVHNTAKDRVNKPESAASGALDMVRCPSCGVFTSGACVNQDCAGSRAHSKS